MPFGRNSNFVLTIVNVQTQFTWDQEKARTNERDHHVPFETASEVFDDPNHVVAKTTTSQNDAEQRFQIIGMTKGLVLLLVVFVDRSKPEIGDYSHHLRARKAAKYEETIYAAAQT